MLTEACEKGFCGVCHKGNDRPGGWCDHVCHRAEVAIYHRGRSIGRWFLPGRWHWHDRATGVHVPVFRLEGLRIRFQERWGRR